MQVQTNQRTFDINLTESEVRQLVERLKFRQTHHPDLTQPIWEALESALGQSVTETPDL